MSVFEIISIILCIVALLSFWLCFDPNEENEETGDTT